MEDVFITWIYDAQHDRYLVETPTVCFDIPGYEAYNDGGVRPAALLRLAVLKA